MKVERSECASLLREAQDILILCHKSPDGDTLGSGYGLCYALEKMGKRVRVACSDPLPQKFSYFYPEIEPQGFEPAFVVAVDVADTQLLGEGLAEYAHRVDLCIDHHISNTGYAKKLYLDTSASAVAEMIPALVKELGVEPDSRMASALYTGIATDTGCFHYSNTTAQTHRVAADLIEVGIDLETINQLLFETKSRGRMELERLAMGTLRYSCQKRCATILISQEMLRTSGAPDEDIDGISSIPRQIEGVEVAVTIREKETGAYKLSLRSKGAVDVSGICQQFGGGGHRNAAGCAIDGTLEEVRQKIEAAVGKALGCEQQ